MQLLPLDAKTLTFVVELSDMQQRFSYLCETNFIHSILPQVREGRRGVVVVVVVVVAVPGGGHPVEECLQGQGPRGADRTLLYRVQRERNQG